MPPFYSQEGVLSQRENPNESLDLSSAILRRAELLDADLTDANLKTVKVAITQLDRAASLRGVAMPDSSRHEGEGYPGQKHASTDDGLIEIKHPRALFVLPRRNPADVTFRPAPVTYDGRECTSVLRPIA